MKGMRNNLDQMIKMNNKMKQLFETQNPDEISDQISPEIDIIVGRIVEKSKIAQIQYIKISFVICICIMLGKERNLVNYME